MSIESPATPPEQAVALHYDGHGAPRVTAKGRGQIARQIIEIAQQHGVPMREDSGLVSLLAEVDLGSEIPHELYLAVAQVLAFAYRLADRSPPPQSE